MIFSLVKADTKPLEEMKKDATSDGIPAIRLAASLALVSAYDILGKSLDELGGLVIIAENEGREVEELRIALKEAQEGKYISACKKNRELKPIDGIDPRKLNKKELGRKTIYSPRSETRKMAAVAIMDKIIQSVGVEFESYYDFRIYHEIKFDQIKEELERNWVGYSLYADDWEQSKEKELTEEVADLLGRMYLAEYLITLKSSFIRDKVSCTSDDNGERQ